MLKKYLVWAAVVLCLIIGTGGAAGAAGTTFCTLTDRTFLYMNKKVVGYEQDGGQVCFRLQKDGGLALTDADGGQVFLRFAACDGSKGGVGYSVRQVGFRNTDISFFEINADAGAHAQNVGYWLIGKRDGRWIEYITLDTLAAAGYDAGMWHRLRSEINEDGKGEFFVISSQEYMPPGALYEYQKTMVDDSKFQLLWDNEAGRFEIKRIF